MSTENHRPAGYCATHGKLLYTSRRSARRGRRETHSPGMRAYRCDITPGMWHIGHLPTVVRRGVEVMP